MKIVVSGIQPTGNLHIGNFLGSLKNWQNLQDDALCVFPIVDLHALSGDAVDAEIYKNVITTFAAYIASGVDLEKSIVFRQSDVSYHAELMWILSNVTQFGKLSRMTQFKDKGKNKESALVGLFTYPVLMAADILLYKATSVPVGHDQLQHLELTNDIVLSFNAKYKVDHFNKITPILSEKTQRVMSLRNAANKMSKSDLSDMTRINLSDSDDLIAQKIKKAKTDAYPEISENLEDRAEVKNLLCIYAGCLDISFEQSLNDNIGKSSAEFKASLTEVLTTSIGPIRDKINSLLNDESYINDCLKKGRDRAIDLSQQNMNDIKKIIGLRK
ncbi:tryptophan--tRNA ligase [Rickettsiales bacterium]|nr:tryptophan--tRNA ligase [Rickettsiales bacterium]